jgi:hypothetical protein
MSKTITRLFDNYSDAEAAVADLERLGVPHSDISLIANERARGSKAAEDAGAGATGGAVVGGVGGLLAGLGILAIPGLGPVVAAGWLAATAVGAGVGAVVGGAAGGLIGALQKEGVSEDDAHVYSEGVRRGGTLVSAKVSDDLVPEADAVLERHRAVDAAARGQAYRRAGWSRFDENAPAYTDDEIACERELYRSETLRG